MIACGHDNQAAVPFEYYHMVALELLPNAQHAVTCTGYLLIRPFFGEFRQV